VSVKPRKISSIKSLFGNLAQTSHYQVIFGGLPVQLTSYLLRRGITASFIAEDAGLLCYNAYLPTTSFLPVAVDGNFTGVVENFAVTRLYTQIGLDFYVDSNYKTLKFLEHWMEFIASGSYNPINTNIETVSQLRSNYFSRIQYPEYYKSNFTRIIKFDRDYNAEIEYRFIGFWPISMSAPTISYVDSDTLKISASFQYDRYIAGKSFSLDEYSRNNNNIIPSFSGSSSTSNEPIIYRTGSSLNESGVRPTRTSPGSVIPTVIR
jgi:hypothetical protein